jgi:hypothetical protein
MPEKKVKPVAKKPVVTKKPATKKPIVKKEPTIKSEPKKTRKPRLVDPSFADLIKKEADFEKAKKKAKIDLQKKYNQKLSETVDIAMKYKELFGETLDTSIKAKGKSSSTKKGTRKSGFTLDQVQTFIDQTSEGKPVKIPGKNAIGVKKIKEAYDKAKDKDAESVLELLK